MKNQYITKNKLSRFIAIAALLIGNVFMSNAQVTVPFVQRTSQYTPTKKIYNVKGDFTMIGNTSLTLQDYGDLTLNNNNVMQYVDTDSPALLGLGGTPTFNSSAANLTLSTENGAIPSCSHIVYAGLYWTGRTAQSGTGANTFAVTKTINGTSYTKTFDKHKIMLKGPNASTYTQFTAGNNDIFYPTTNYDWIYSATVEVTDYVRTQGVGQYFAADIASREGNGGGTGYSGGWGMIIVYENSKMKYRDVTIFDGHAYVLSSNSATIDLPVTGFNTVQTGQVGVKLGMMASEGDVNLVGDYFSIQKTSDNSYLNLSHSTNSPTNFFNSSINTGGNPRNPTILNNTGIDISMFNVPNSNNTVIGNNQTSTNFRYGTAGDTYAIFAIAMAVDAYIPDVEGSIAATNINGVAIPAGSGTQTALPGQDITFKVQIKNKGTEAINNTKLIIPIPYNASFVANSTSKNVYFTPLPTPNALTYEPTVGANGSLVWDFGKLPLPANPDTVLADLTFKLKVTEDCTLLKNSNCNNIIAVNGSLSGTGAITGIPVNSRSLIQGFTSTGSCDGVEIPAPLLVNIDAVEYVNQHCQGTPPITAFTFCNSTGGSIPITEVSGGFPPGSLYYNQYPVVSGQTTQYTVGNPFPATVGTATYYAVPPGVSNGCYFQFTITVTTITSLPTVADIHYCVGETAAPLTATVTTPGYILFYYTSTTSSAQTSITPSTATAGTTTYYVAQGQSTNCIGPKKPIVVTVYAVPNAPICANPIQPTCTVATGSVVLSGLPSGNWTITQSGAASNTYTGTGGTYTVSGLTPGNYTFTVSVNSCSSNSSVSITINPAPATPTTPVCINITQPTCTLATGSAMLNGLPSGNWTITQSGTASNTYSGSGSSYTVSGLATGTYTFTVTNSVGCTSTASQTVTINAQPTTPNAPIAAAPVQPTCQLATGSVVLSGLPTGNWTVTQSGTSANTYNGSGSTFTVSGLATGNYTFTITNSVGCISVSSASVTINAQPSTPATPVCINITQPTCTLATGSAMLSGLPSGNWTVTQSGAANNTYNGSGSTFTVSGLATGNYTFTITNSVGCISVSSASVTINAQPETPSAPIAAAPVQPTCQLATGSVVLSGLPTANWTVTQSGTANNTYNGSGSTFTVSGLATGNYTFTITNSVGCISVSSASVTINAQPATPATPVCINITQPTCTLATGSAMLNGLPSGNWTITQSGTASNTYSGSGSSYTVSGLATGTYTFTVTNSVGCTSTASQTVTINAQPTTPNAPIAAAPVQPTCQLATGSAMLNGLPSGNWTITQSGTASNTYSGSGSSYTVLGLATGTYTFTVTNSVGCTSTASQTVTINPQPATPNAPIAAAPVQPTCQLATGSVVLSGLPSGNWTVTQSGTANNTYNGSGSTFTVSGLATGNYTFTITNSVGCISVSSASVTINAQPETPNAPIAAAPVQPTCQLATGSVVLSGLPIGNWTVAQSGTANNIYNGSGSTFTVSGLAAGNYTFTITNSVGCISVSSASVTINAQPETPNSPIAAAPVQPTCQLATGSVVLSGLPSGNWTVTQSGTANNIYNGSGSTFTVSGLAAGNYTFTITNSVGCISVSSASVTINAQPATPATPVCINITQPTCTVATGSAMLNGLPSGNWTITQSGTASNTYSGSGSSYTVSGLATGTYTFTVTNSVGCTSTASQTVTINAQPTTPNAPIAAAPVQPTCDLATGSVVLSGLPSGNWTVTQSGTANNTYNGSGSTFTVSGLATGNYTFTITNSVGCISVSSASVTINAQPETPNSPIAAAPVQPTCQLATGSVVLSGLPSGNWTVTQSGTANNTYNGSGSTFTVSGLATGNYTFTITNSVGCISVSSASVTINAQPETPATPVCINITQPTCTLATGSAMLNGLPSGNWTITQSGTASNTYSGSGSSYTVSGLATGTYTFTVTNSVGCTSTASQTVTINAQPTTPNAPIAAAPVQPTCQLATGSVVLSGLPSGNWTVTQSGAANNTYNGSGSTFTVSGLATGNYTFTITNSVGCISVSSASVTINAQPETPNSPIVAAPVQPTCQLATGSVVLSGLPTGNWTVTQSGTANNTYNGSGSTFTVSGLAAGNYTFTITNSVGCISVSSASVTINAQPETPNSPIVAAPVQPTCQLATGSVVLSGLPSGNWTVTQSGTANNIYNGSGSTFTVSGLAAGNYTFTITNSVGCISVSSASVTINAQPATPATPVCINITQPTCTVATGSAMLNGLPSGNWTITQSGTASNTYSGSGSSYTVSGLTTGTYTFTVTNSVGCTSTASQTVTINAQPTTPNAPIAAAPVQPTCDLATGSVVLSGLPSGNWTVTQSGTANNTYNGSGSTFTVSGLATGNYTFTITNSVGCISVSSASVTINAQPETPNSPIAAAPVQPTCQLATGSVVLSGLPLGDWTITQSGTAANTYTGTGDTFTVSGLATGTYTFTVTNAVGCISTASTTVTIDAQPETPSAPIAAAPVQPTCQLATGSVVLSGLPLGDWTITQSGTAANTYTGSGDTYTVSGLATGTYTFTVTNAVGCISTASTTVTIDAQPETPSAPIAAAPVQPTCQLATGSVVLSGLPLGDWTITQSGTAANTYTGTGDTYTVSGLATGTYTFTVTNAVGCISTASTTVTIDAQPETPSAPIAAAPVQPTCQLATGSVVLSGLPLGDWTITQSGTAANTYTGTGDTYTVSGLATGTYTFTVTNAVGCISTASTTVTIDAQPETPSAPIAAAPVQPTCQLATGSVVLSGLPLGDWTITQSGTAANTYTGTGDTFTVSGLATGTYTFTVTNAVGCISTASTTVTIDAQPETPSAPIAAAPVQPTCQLATGSVVLSGLPLGDWTITQSGTAANTYTGTGDTFTVSGLATGTYTFTVTNAVGCISTASTTVTIDAQPETPSAPIAAAPVQPTCQLATGSVVLSGLPLGDWTITQSGTAANTYTGTGDTYTVSGLATGTYTFTVTNAVGCISTASTTVTIDAQPETPSAPIAAAPVQPTCQLATGSVVLSGLPLGDWTITQSGTAANTYTGTGDTFTVSGLATGTYTFTVTNAVGCISTASTTVTIDAQPETPSAPIAAAPVQPTCQLATGSVVLSGLPLGDWTITQSGTAANTYTGTGDTYTVSGLATGTYTFTVTNAVGCISTASTTVTIDAQPETPSAPIAAAPVQPTCQLATGSVVLSGLPLGDWTITQSGTAANTYTGTGDTFTVSGLATGTYTFTVTNAVGCISTASTTVTIDAQPETPSAPIAAAPVQPTCQLATGSVVLSGLPLGDWTITQSGTAANTYTGTGDTFTVSGLATGTYTFTVTNAVGCISSASTTVTIDAQPETPSAPIAAAPVQPTCQLATGSVVLSGLPLGDWTITQSGTAANTYTGTGDTFTVSGLATGTYTFTVTNAVGCISTASTTVTIDAQPETPSAPIAAAPVQPTCQLATGSVVLSGLPLGDWTITQSGTAANTYTGTGDTFTVSGLATGTYTFTVTNAVGCISTASTTVTIDAQPETPNAPISAGDQTICNTSESPILTATATVDPGQTVVWYDAPTGGNVVVNPTLTTVGTVTYYAEAVATQGQCSSVVRTPVTLTILATPDGPISGGNQTVCAANPVQTLTATATAPAGVTVVWYDAITGGNVVANPTLSTVGTVTYYAEAAAGTCTSVTRTPVTLTINPTPSAPIAGTVTQPTCTVATGSVVLTGLPTDGTWMINGNISGTGSTYTVTDLSPGSYVFTVTNMSGCMSTASVDVIINPQPVTPNAPISAGDQTICNTSESPVLNATATVDPGQTVVWYDAPVGGNVVVNPTLTTVGTVTYYAEAAVTQGQCSSAVRTPVTLTIINAPVAPISGNDVTECEASPIQTLTATATVSTGQTITWYDAISGGNVVANPTLNTVGTVTYYAEADNGICTSVARTPVTLTINAIATAPIVGTTTDSTCDDATGTVELSGLPANGVWTVTQTGDSSNTYTGTGSTYTVIGLAAGNYTFAVTSSGGCVSTPSTEAQLGCVAPAGDCVPVVHNAFSPNNDGMNDVFEIENFGDTTCIPTNSVEIYNRWGVLVYETHMYDNNVKVFRGHSEGRVTVDKGAQLPTGTYFYIIHWTDKNGKKFDKEGYLYLSI